MKLAIIGIRYIDAANKIVFDDSALVEKTIEDFFTYAPNIQLTAIVSGGAIGADSLGEQYADNNLIPKLIFKPDWEKHGKSAGFIRNQDIIEAADFVLAFWDKGGTSKGTGNSLSIAKKLGKPTLIIYV